LPLIIRVKPFFLFTHAVKVSPDAYAIPPATKAAEVIMLTETTFAFLETLCLDILKLPKLIGDVNSVAVISKQTIQNGVISQNFRGDPKRKENNRHDHKCKFKKQ
jgi:hypothetical protein